MESEHITSSFGRRPLTLEVVATQVASKKASGDPIHKWKTFRSLTECKDRYGLSDRTLAVLNALLTCLPETALTAEQGLIVFPSNRQLSLRSHGMSEATLRRHLNALVQSGLLTRKDSPNGKRFVRRNSAGNVEVAFGFDLTPFVAKADEIQGRAEQAREDKRSAAMARERITILRRDISKMIDLLIFEQPSGMANTFAQDFARLSERLPRSVTPEMLKPLEKRLRELAGKVESILSSLIPNEDMSGNDAQYGAQHQNSNTDHITESEKVAEIRTEPKDTLTQNTDRKNASLPLSTVLKACPDIGNYTRTGVNNWSELLNTANLVRGILGISPSAWEDARQAMGDINAGIVIAAMLQSAEKIQSPGGYLRVLTSKARAAGFSPIPMVLALLRTSRPSVHRIS